MADSARSSDPAVQRQLERLTMLSPGRDVLGLERITRLLARLGDPHKRLPPVFHVAGTNGKGSTCAFLRAAIETAGYSAHVYTSPHLVRFNERIRVGGSLIDDDVLAPLLADVLDHADDIAPSFFEVTTAAAFLAFSGSKADACIIEVGLGGRLDATNVIERPAVCGIAQLGIDHQAFLGDTIGAIAGEKAGIAKADVPLVCMRYSADAFESVKAAANAASAPLFVQGDAWEIACEVQTEVQTLKYTDRQGEITAPLPRLPGPHQAGNAGLAFAMLRHQRALAVGNDALVAATQKAEWPARLQRLARGPLTAVIAETTEIWLDGGHNPAAGGAIADFVAARAAGRPVDIVIGMLDNKDPAGLLEPFKGLVRDLYAVPVPDHGHHPAPVLIDQAKAIGAEGHAAADVRGALAAIGARAPGMILILGSLYLAGAVLAENDQFPR